MGLIHHWECLRAISYKRFIYIFFVLIAIIAIIMIRTNNSNHHHHQLHFHVKYKNVMIRKIQMILFLFPGNVSHLIPENISNPKTKICVILISSEWVVGVTHKKISVPLKQFREKRHEQSRGEKVVLEWCKQKEGTNKKGSFFFCDGTSILWKADLWGVADLFPLILFSFCRDLDALKI